MGVERVVVTGGSGLLGHFVVEALAGRFDVVVLDRVAPAATVEHRLADVLDLAAVRDALQGAGAVVHLAGIDAGNPFPDETYFRTNVLGTWNVLHAAREAGLRQAVVASSQSAYGLGPGCPPRRLPIDESHPRTPADTYGLSKQVIEDVCEAFARRGGLRVVCLRPAHIVRPQTEAPILAQLALDDPESAAPAGARTAGGVVPYGPLPLLRGYVRSRDAARCFRDALAWDGAPYAVFNVSAADTMGREDVLARVERIYGTLPAELDRGRYERDAHASLLDTTRARECLGWEPDGDWRDVEAAHR